MFPRSRLRHAQSSGTRARDVVTVVGLSRTIASLHVCSPFRKFFHEKTAHGGKKHCWVVGWGGSSSQHRPAHEHHHTHSVTVTHDRTLQVSRESQQHSMIRSVMSALGIKKCVVKNTWLDPNSTGHCTITLLPLIILIIG